MAALTTTEASIEERSLSIVKAAYRVMSRRGVHRVPLTEVADEAGVSKGLVLYHYGSKDALVLAALEWVLRGTATRLRAAVEESVDAVDAIRAVVAAVWRNPQANRDFFRFYLDGVEHQTRVDGFDSLGATATEIIEGHYAEILGEAMLVSSIPATDPSEAAATMRAIVEGFFLQWLQRADWEDSHAEYRQRCTTAVLATVGAPR
jgi:AcrR family transcriptional regulator